MLERRRRSDWKLEEERNYEVRGRYLNQFCISHCPRQPWIFASNPRAQLSSFQTGDCRVLAGDKVSPVKIGHDQNLKPPTQGRLGLVRGVGAPIPPGVLPGSPAQEGWGGDRNSPCLLVEGEWKTGGGRGWLLSPVSREAEESARPHQGGLVVRMASFLGTVATKPFPRLLHSSDCSFPECYENLQLPNHPWVGAVRPSLLSSKIH